VRAAVALGLTLIVVLAGAVAVLNVERTRLAGTNNVFEFFPNVPIAPGQEACAIAEPVPGDSAAVRVRAEPAGPLDVRLVEGGRTIARGSVEEASDGQVDIPISPVVERTLADVDVCFTNTGDAELSLWGYGANEVLPQRTVIDGSEPIRERVRLSYLRPGSESGWDVIGSVAHRMGIGRGDLLEGWAFYGWVLALAGTLIAAVLALRWGARR
jgi:hypothetical protein